MEDRLGTDRPHVVPHARPLPARLIDDRGGRNGCKGRRKHFRRWLSNAHGSVAWYVPWYECARAPPIHHLSGVTGGMEWG